MRGRTGSWMAGTTLLAYWVPTAAGFLLRVIHDPAMDLTAEVTARIGWGAYPTTGAVIVARQPRNRVGWLCCAVGFLLGPAFFGQDYGWYALMHERGSLPGGWAMAWLGQWPWAIAVGLIWFVVLLFPNGRLVSPRWRLVAWMGAADLAGLWVWAAFAPRPLEAVGLEELANPLGIEQAEVAFARLSAIVVPIGALVALLSVASIVVRFRRVRGVERQQLKWFTYAAALVILLWLLLFVAGLDRWLPPVLAFIASDIWLGAIPAAIGIAVLRYRLYDIDRLINRTLVYGLVTAVLAGVYAAVVLVLGQLFGGIGGEPPSWVVAGATLAVAALFQPARRRIQQVVDRRLQSPQVRRRQDGRGVQRPLAGRGRPGRLDGRAARGGRPDDPTDKGVVVALAIGPRVASHNALTKSALASAV